MIYNLKEETNGDVGVRLTKREFQEVHDAVAEVVEGQGYSVPKESLEVLRNFWQHLHSHFH